MVKLVFQFGILLWVLNLGTIPSGAAASVPPMKAVAQDGSGTVWALPLENQGSDDTTGKVYFLRAGLWVAQSLPETAGFRSRTVIRGDDGSVYVLWQKWDSGQNQMTSPCLVTKHQGAGSRLLARFPDSFAPDATSFSLRSLWVGVGGDIWIAESNAALQHVTPDGTVRSFPSDPKEFFGGQSINGFPSWPMSSHVDSLGRRWFWQDCSDSWNPNNRHGVLIWDGKTLAYHPTLVGLPNQAVLDRPYLNPPFSAVKPHDANHLWLALAGSTYTWQPHFSGGLYQLDTKTLAAVPIAPPSKDAFQNITRLFQANGDWYVLTGPTMSQPHTCLWRRQGNGWYAEPEDLALSLHGDINFMPQATLQTAAGTWLAVYGAGLQWLPKGKPAVRIDWRRGFPLSRVSDLFQLPDGKIMAFGGGGMTLMLPLPHPLYPPRRGVTVGKQAVTVNVATLAADPHRHLWGLEYLDNNQHAVDEWNGRQWSQHRLPKEILGANGFCTLYACDTLGRLWLTTRTSGPPPQSNQVEGRAVYDPAHASWTKYDTVAESLQSAASVPGMAFLQNNALYNAPVFSGDGQVAYTDNALVFLIGSHSTRHWQLSDIKPGISYWNSSDPLRFSSQGRLEAEIGQETWEWTGENGWMVTGLIKPANQAPAPALPPGGPSGYWGPPLTDNRGAKWAKYGTDIYLIRHGIWRKQAALSGPGSPFCDGRGLEDVLQDPNGHYFFLTAPGGYYEHVVWSPPITALPPAPHIQVTPLSDDTVRLKFAVNLHGPNQYQWRLNGGAWNLLQKSSSVVLCGLKPRSYRVEAQTINTLLEESPRPSAAAFEILPASAIQVSRWIQALLSGTEDERESAAAALSKQGGIGILTALKSAHYGASEEGQWWLDAVIQQITTTDHEPEPEGGE